MDVRPLTGDEWRLKRDLRLAALLDSPKAFASSYTREVNRAEADWRDWPVGGAFFTAFDDTTPVGIAGSRVMANDPDVTHLISMWVTPEARGRRVAARLVDAVTGWARDHSTSIVELEVAAGNDAALTAYRRCGFIAVDREPFTPGGTILRLPLPPNP